MLRPFLACAWSACFLLSGCGPRVASTPVTPRVMRLGAGVDLLAEYESRELGVPSVVTANDAEELNALWKAMLLAGDPPPVNFVKALVVAYAERVRSSAGQGEPHCLIDGIRLSESRLLAPSCRAAGNLEAGWDGPTYVRVAVLAVDRAQLPVDGVDLLDGMTNQWMRVETTAARAVQRASHAATTPSTAAVDSPPAANLGGATLPPPGAVCLARLENGEHAWVVRHGSGDVSVIAGDYVIEPVHARVAWEFASAKVRDRPAGVLTYDAVRGYRVPTAWDPTTRSFGGLFDEYGTPVVASLAPLDHHLYLRTDGQRIRIGERVPGSRRSRLESVGFWPSRAYPASPAYIGAEYEPLAPAGASLDRVSGAIAVSGSLVGFPDGTVRLCPGEDSLSAVEVTSSQYASNALPRSCDASARTVPRVTLSSRRRVASTIPVVAGPLLVFAAEGRMDRVVALGARAIEPAAREKRKLLYCDARTEDESRE